MKLLCVGEMLWDVLPEGEFLGGAPLNVALHARRLGLDTQLVSRLGDDDRGRRALERVRAFGLTDDLIQIDPAYPTGIAAATLGADGSATYQFPSPCAWDAVEATPAALAAARGATLIYGTLAQRSGITRRALTQLLDVAAWRVFDANLRAPHDDADVTLSSLERAHLVKLNEHEVAAIAGWLDVPADADALFDRLQSRFGIRSLCVTEGERGARLWHEGARIVQAAVPTVVADTIGAGDSFLAMLLAELLRGEAATSAMRRAARLAAFVASQPGASPDYRAADFRD
jgi:fructokinase